MLKGIALIAGVALLGLTAHATIGLTSGYGSPHAYVTLGIAAATAIAAIALGSIWSARRHLAIATAACMLAGELFGLITTAERLMAAREAAQAPLQAATEIHTKAAKRVADAEAALSRVSTTSARLEASLAEKRAADAAASDKSTERGCRENCRQLLQARVDAATAEISSARSAIASLEAAAKTELQVAREAFAGLKPPPSATPLADRIGVPAWALDLVAVALGSVAANGLGCCLIAFAGHGRRQLSPATIDVTAETVQPQPVSALDCVRRFAIDRLFPAGTNSATDVTEIRSALRQWFEQNGIAPPPGPDLGRAMAAMFERIGVSVERRGDRLMAIGVSLQGEQAALPKPGATIGERLGSRRRKQFA